MTAERQWVRFGARWIARVDSVKGHLSLVFQGMSGVGIASGALKYLGLGDFIAPFLAILAVSLLGYAYLYSEGGVWNQVSRDRSDMSNNFATPRDVIDDTLIATGVFAAMHGRQPKDDEIAVISDSVRSQWETFRNGIDLEASD